MMYREVYADNAATTKMDKRVIEKISEYWEGNDGNPSSIYRRGLEAKNALEEARAKVASLIGAEPNEIYFTSGGSESDNWAINSAFSLAKGKCRIITSAIEHHAVLYPLQQLKKRGCEIIEIPVSSEGIVDPSDVEAAINEDTKLITIMTANNEIGTIQPIKEIAEIARKHKVTFHTDAVQAVGHIPINVKELGVDMLSASAHKFNGPKGIGFLYVRKGTRIAPYIVGGAQENKKRAGTENTACAIGLSEALSIAVADMDKNTEKLVAMRDKLIKGVLDTIPYSRLNGSAEKRLPGNVNFSIEFIEGEALILSLDFAGISASSGSACTSGSLDPSHVLLAIGLPHAIAHGSLRLTLSHENTMEDVDYILETLPIIVKRLRDMSPLWEGKE